MGLFLCAATAAPGQLGWHVGLQLRQGEHDVEQRDAAIFNKAVADSVVLDQVVLVVPVLLPVLLRERSVPGGAAGEVSCRTGRPDAYWLVPAPNARVLRRQVTCCFAATAVVPARARSQREQVSPGGRFAHQRSLCRPAAAFPRI